MDTVSSLGNFPVITTTQSRLVYTFSPKVIEGSSSSSPVTSNLVFSLVFSLSEAALSTDPVMPLFGFPIGLDLGILPVASFAADTSTEGFFRSVTIVVTVVVVVMSMSGSEPPI